MMVILKALPDMESESMQAPLIPVEILGHGDYRINKSPRGSRDPGIAPLFH